jgi:hypothetical protein
MGVTSAASTCGDGASPAPTTPRVIALRSAAATLSKSNCVCFASATSARSTSGVHISALLLQARCVCARVCCVMDCTLRYILWTTKVGWGGLVRRATSGCLTKDPSNAPRESHVLHHDRYPSSVDRAEVTAERPCSRGVTSHGTAIVRGVSSRTHARTHAHTHTRTHARTTHRKLTTHSTTLPQHNTTTAQHYHSTTQHNATLHYTTSDMTTQRCLRVLHKANKVRLRRLLQR